MNTLIITAMTVAAISASAAFAQSSADQTPTDQGAGSETLQRDESGDAAMQPEETAVTAAAEGEQFGQGGYTSTDGEDIYQTLCAGCHMPDGGGAIGAGAYPALAGNPNLEYSGYAVSLIVNGQKAMPAFGTFLDDEQIVALTTYLQTNLGNDYTPDATIESVADARPAEPVDPNTAEHE
ncbi:cytochrome c [Paracoccus sp. TK19116]|uniref:Cytochrome c n=1 Tax=Paracoccus albicereus TaxID=2922394 RepID=A0ABT1MMQ5_9RHOB|nr:cytochrome c [Paracoccus albicereus]MCQ0969567.1 cytochrome c [Paracoccus albicereus]